MPGPARESCHCPPPRCARAPDRLMSADADLGSPPWSWFSAAARVYGGLICPLELDHRTSDDRTPMGTRSRRWDASRVLKLCVGYP